jgi:sulfite reductase alpha subunit-like flavoprotein
MIDLVTAQIADDFQTQRQRPYLLSTCPAFVNHIEKNLPAFLNNLSNIRSPAQCFAQLIQDAFPEIPADSLHIVQITPCIAVKEEIQRMQFGGAMHAALTVREVVQMLDQFGIEWGKVIPSTFESEWKCSSQRAPACLIPGGWTRGVLAYLHEKQTHTAPSDLDLPYYNRAVFHGCVKIADSHFTVGLCDGLSAGEEFLSSTEYGDCDIIEICACVGGCANGGGQPKLSSRCLAASRATSLTEMGKNSLYATALSSIAAFSVKLKAAITNVSPQCLRTHFDPRPVRLEFVSQRIAAEPLVVYGSSSGTASNCARLVASFLHTSSFSMNKLTICEMLARGIVIFLCSTMGDGEFPVNARRFAAELAACTEDLSGVTFAVLALGRHEARLYAEAGRKIHEGMLARGAKPMLPLTCLDSSAPDGDEGKYAEWSRELATTMYLRKPKVSVDADKAVGPSNPNGARPIGFEFSTVIDISLLTEEGQVPAVRCIQMKLPDGMSYDAGAILAVLPCNPDSAVEEGLSALHLNANAGFAAAGDPVIPGQLSIQNLFTQFLDLGGMPPRELLRAFANAANGDGKAKLAPLIDEKDNTAYAEYTRDISTGECICQFAQFGVPTLETLVSTIPHMRPRLYSITSLPQALPGLLEICVMEVSFGKGRHGIASHFLAERNGKTVAIAIRPVQFRYPSDHSIPIILVARGSGIAGMLSMLALRATAQEKLGPCLLIVGTRYMRSFQALIRRFNDMVDKKMITKFVQIASRDGPKPMHIQQWMKENSATLWESWEDHRTAFFYCGPQGDIAKDLLQVMIETTVNEGWLAIEEAFRRTFRPIALYLNEVPIPFHDDSDHSRDRKLKSFV